LRLFLHVDVAMDRVAFSYRFGTAEFDESRFELRVAGLPVEVERRALEVLVLLLRHAGEVVTKEELLAQVWAGRVTVDKVLPNAINKLRRALGEANAGLVATQARMGYRLDGPVTRTAVGRQPLSQFALAPGQAVPGRASWLLQRQLARSGGGEVWLAEHPKTHERRVYKFALDGERLRGLKREVTLLRVLHEGLADARHVVEVLDWNFEQAPYFIECRDAGHTLTEWAAQHLGGTSTAERLALFLQVADAVADAHAMGVLHKDLKPANVLVSGSASHPHVRLSDFGSGHLLEPDRLEQMGITRLGLTVEEQSGLEAASGTPLYLAPELFEGHAPTVKSDVYSLGILLYQVLTQRLGQPMASGWEADIADPLLREDLRLCTDGNPQRRLGSAAELAQRLRRLEERREADALRSQQLRQAEQDREALARTRARRPYLVALVGLLAIGLVAAFWLQQQALAARNQARTELARASALARFLNEDLIGRANPLVSAKGAETTLGELLNTAQGRVAERFKGQPETAAEIHTSLAQMYTAVDLFDDALAQAQSALALLGPQPQGDTALRARALLVITLTQKSRMSEAQQELRELEQQAQRASSSTARLHVAMARSSLHTGQGNLQQAGAELRRALAELQASEPDNRARADALRLALVTTLASAADHAAANQEGQALIAEARQRAGDHQLLVALTQLALARAQGENHSAAQALLLAAQPVVTARLGETHTRSLRLLAELQGVAFRSAEWPRALALAQQLHERMVTKFGPTHAKSALVLLNWARTLGEAGQTQAALEKGRQAHAQTLAALGPDAPQSHDASFLLAGLELQAGHTAAGLRLLERLEPAQLEAFRATGIWAAAVDALRGVALYQGGQHQAAAALLTPALAQLKREEALTQPSRVYLLAKSTWDRLR